MSQQFTPCFIFSDELETYGLPDATKQSDIMNIVQMASQIIDERCGKLEGDGNGSLIYTTYRARILMQTRNRNLILLPQRPIVALDEDAVDELQTLAGVTGNNYYYTGVLPNTLTRPDGQLSGIVGCSGRYGYVRQNEAVGWPDQFSLVNPLNLVTMFGGPPSWTAVDVGNMDYDHATGECWVPSGLQLQRYSEVVVTWNSGYHPLHLPKAIKSVCASVVKNLLAKGDATTAMISMQVAKSGINLQMGADVIDPILDRMLTPFKMVRAY